MFTKLNRDTLAQQVAHNLVEYIRSQELKPGDKLSSEGKLAADFGVSRPIIREALKLLEGRGLIEIVNGKLPTIKPLTSDPLRRFFQRAVTFQSAIFLELIEVRRGIENQCAVLAAQRRTADELAEMKRITMRMRADLHDPVVFAEHDVALHLAIASATHNSLMFYLVESIRDTMKDTILAGLRYRFTDEQFQIVQQRHEALVAALEAGDPDEARRAMDLHFDEALKAVTYIIE